MKNKMLDTEEFWTQMDIHNNNCFDQGNSLFNNDSFEIDITLTEINEICDKKLNKNNNLSCVIQKKIKENINVKKDDNAIQKEIKDSKEENNSVNFGLNDNNNYNHSLLDDKNVKIHKSNKQLETNMETINDNKNNIFISESKNEKALTHKFSSFDPSKRSKENHKKRDTIRSIKTFIIDLLKNYANKLIENTDSVF